MQISRFDGKIFLKFAYDQDLVAKCKQVPGRKWDPVGRQWVFPDCQPVLSFLKHFFGFSFADWGLPRADDTPYDTQITPYEHQRKITHLVNAGISQGVGIGVFSETGTGKTKAIVDIASLRPSGKFLVVCPATLINVWVDEANSHGKYVETIHGTKRKVNPPLHSGFYITSYQTLVNDIKLYRHIAWDAIFIDESQCIKEPGTKRTRAVRKLQGPKYLLTGTPYGNRLQDLWCQIHTIDPNAFGPREAFLAAFCVFGGWEDKEIIGYKNQAMFYEILRRKAIVVRKADCLDIPPKTYQTIRLGMSRPQEKVYQRACDGAIGDQPIENILTQVAKLRQISSGFVYSEGSCTKIDRSEKLSYLASIDLTCPTIIWYNFDQEREDVKAEMRKLGVAFLVADGENKASAAVKEFEAATANVLIAQLQSVQFGLTINRAHRVIYYSPSFSLLQRLQSEDRCHRIGQTKSVHYVSLICSEIEAWIMKAVEKKTEIKDFVIEQIRLTKKTD
jgi:SNF2 family DNA or RNA helicase